MAGTATNVVGGLGQTTELDVYFGGIYLYPGVNQRGFRGTDRASFAGTAQAAPLPRRSAPEQCLPGRSPAGFGQASNESRSLLERLNGGRHHHSRR